MYSEIPNSQDFDENFPPSSEIVKILKQSNNTRHRKDITSDIVENIILSRSEKTELENNKIDYAEGKAKIIKFIRLHAIFTFLLYIGVIYLTISSSSRSKDLDKKINLLNRIKTNQLDLKGDSNILFPKYNKWGTTPPFPTITDLKKFGNFKIYGKDRKLKEVVSKLKKNIFEIESKTEDELTQENFDVTDKNYLFYGEPGTGKTLFIKALVYRLDLELKIASEIDKVGGKEEFDKLNPSKDYLMNLPSRVVLVQVSPSDIFSQYVGESEKAVQNLFDYLDYLQKNKTVIVFFDEADAVFGDLTYRSAGSYDSNVRAQFLSGLDGISTHRKRKTFIFAATNFRNSMGDAISRRLKNKYEFSLPDEKERVEIFEALLPKEIYQNPPKIKELENISEGMATASITECIDYAKAANVGKGADKLYKTLIDVIKNRELLRTSIYDLEQNQYEDLEFDKYI